MLSLQAITFNVNPTSADGTITLRRNADEPIAWPEWQRGLTFSALDSPVCYSLADLVGRQPSILARFSRLFTDPVAFELRALAPPTAPAPLPPSFLVQPQLIWPATYWFTSTAEYQTAAAYSSYYQQWQASRRTRPNPLGAVGPAVVMFPAGSSDVTVVLPLAEQRLADRGVGIDDIAWRWQARPSALHAWTDIAVTTHRVYAVLRQPTLPWLAQPVTPGNDQLPWCEALDVACRWADGTIDDRGAASSIANALNSLGPALFEYGCPIGALTMYGSVFGVDAFDCTAFLERVNAGIGNGRYLNCTDCATIVSTLANLVGCDLWQSRMGLINPPFDTNPIQAIGTVSFQSPCGWGLGFTYHEVAWTDACNVDDHVYDACVKVIGEAPNPFAPPSSSVPVDLRFGEVGSGGYRDLIAAPTSAAFCVPRPFDRKRRVVV